MLFSIVIYKIAYDLKFYKTAPFYLHFVNTLSNNIQKTASPLT